MLGPQFAVAMCSTDMASIATLIISSDILRKEIKQYLNESNIILKTYLKGKNKMKMFSGERNKSAIIINYFVS